MKIFLLMWPEFPHVDTDVWRSGNHDTSCDNLMPVMWNGLNETLRKNGIIFSQEIMLN